MGVWHLCSSFENQKTGALSQGSARRRNTRGKEGGVKKVSSWETWQKSGRWISGGPNMCVVPDNCEKENAA